MDIKTLPGNIVAFFGAIVLMVGVLNLTQDMWGKAPWFALFCAASVVYLIIRALVAYDDSELAWQRVAAQNWERGHVAGKKGY